MATKCKNKNCDKYAKQGMIYCEKHLYLIDDGKRREKGFGFVEDNSTLCDVNISITKKDHKATIAHKDKSK